MLTKKDKEEIKEIVVDVIQDVVMPAFNTVATKQDIKNLAERVEQIDSKLDIFTGKTTDHTKKLANYGERLQKLEHLKAAA